VSPSDRAEPPGTSDDDARWMRRALQLAERGWGRVAPNPLVGAVVVRAGENVGEGWHSEYGAPHAEVEALRSAGDRARGASLYVTLEPCAHEGKTPPCTDAIQAAGIRRVVFAARDPNPKAAGGAETLRTAGLDVVDGVEERAALDLNAPFFHVHSDSGGVRPWLALKLALSLDARIADAEGRSAWITGEPARAEVHRLRAGYDAVAVGIGTALADDPRLTVRGEADPRIAPVRIVFDRLLRLPADGYLARTAREIPVLVVGSPVAEAGRADALARAGVEVIPAADLVGAMRALRERGIRSVFCEGGAALAGALLAADLVDRLHLFYAPLFLGEGGRAPFRGLPDARMADVVRWRHLYTDRFGEDTLITLAR
jgi:diaminohydroxyphosphoribosylaminopyrimidine deaminase / 5-amino-6-(5-phosphoribosylamino)uracil reductase